MREQVAVALREWHRRPHDEDGQEREEDEVGDRRSPEAARGSALSDGGPHSAADWGSCRPARAR